MLYAHIVTYRGVIYRHLYSNRMAFASKAIYALGAVFFLNSGYSTYQFTQLTNLLGDSKLSVPLDIKIEVLLGTLCFLIGSILSLYLDPSNSNEKRNVVTGEIIKGYKSTILKPINMREATIEDQVIGVCEFEGAENKPSFFDIVKKRQEYSEYLDELDS